MKQLLATLAAVTAAISGQAQAQTFSNLDFEAASTAGAIPPFGFLPWATAVPGWQHSAGSDATAVYYGITHVGTTQWFLLVDSTAQPGTALSGNYSLRFASGYQSSTPGAPWVNAYLSQSGTVPMTAQSLRLLASGPLEIRINGSVAPLVSTGPQSFAVDLSAYAGSFAEIQFVNAAVQRFEGLTIDDIVFSAAPVPEPAAWMLFGAGLGALWGWRRKHGRAQRARQDGRA